MTDAQQLALDAITSGDLPWVAETDLDPATLAELLAAGWLEVWPGKGVVTLTPLAARVEPAVKLVERLIQGEEIPHWVPASRPERPVKMPRERGWGQRPDYWWDRLEGREADPALEAEIHEAATAVLQSDLDPEWGDESPVTLFGNVPLMRTRGKGWHGAGRRTAV
jgi:hypothetical protein